jgi:flagellar basal body rod protein FlgB
MSNIANMDTPNYKAFDVIVEEEMEKDQKGIRSVHRSSRTHHTAPGR